MPSASFELDENGPEVFRLKLAALSAALHSQANIIAVERFGPMLRLTFDRDISQALIVHILTLLIEGDVRNPDIQRDSSSLVGCD